MEAGSSCSPEPGGKMINLIMKTSGGVTMVQLSVFRL